MGIAKAIQHEEEEARKGQTSKMNAMSKRILEQKQKKIAEEQYAQIAQVNLFDEVAESSPVERNRFGFGSSTKKNLVTQHKSPNLIKEKRMGSPDGMNSQANQP